MKGVITRGAQARFRRFSHKVISSDLPKRHMLWGHEVDFKKCGDRFYVGSTLGAIAGVVAANAFLWYRDKVVFDSLTFR